MVGVAQECAQIMHIFNHRMVFKSEMSLLETLSRLKILTTVGEQVFADVTWTSNGLAGRREFDPPDQSHQTRRSRV